MAERVTLHDKSFEIFIQENEIMAGISSVSKQISEDYPDAVPLFLIVLKGAFMFGSELVSKFQGNCHLGFVNIRSYEGMKSTGKVQISGLDPDTVKDRDVIVVEDIVDSGRTLHKFLPVLKELAPKSVKIATLLSKPGAIQFPIPVAYCGFEISDEFVVGFGLDYDGLGRNLRDIYQVVSDS